MKHALRILEDPTNTSEDVLWTDQQLMMVLCELVCSSSSASSAVQKERGGVTELDGLTFPEFLQCYRVVINGMQALEMLPSFDEPNGPMDPMGRGLVRTHSSEAAQVVHHLRTTTTNRVLAMIQTFARRSLDRTRALSTSSLQSTEAHQQSNITPDEMRNILTGS